MKWNVLGPASAPGKSSLTRYCHLGGFQIHVKCSDVTATCGHDLCVVGNRVYYVKKSGEVFCHVIQVKLNQFV